MSEGAPFQIERPSYGLFLDREEVDMDPRALAEAMSVRIRDGALTNEFLGYGVLTGDVPPVRITGVEELFDRAGNRTLFIGTDDDLLEFDPVTGDCFYLTPRYQVGTAASVGTACGGAGTLWNTADPNRSGENAVQAGDEIHFAGIDERSVSGGVNGWIRIASVNSDISLTLEAPGFTTGGVTYTIRQKLGGVLRRYWTGASFLNCNGPLAVPANGGTRVAGDDLFYLTNGAAILSVKFGEDEAARLDLGHTCLLIVRHKNRMVHANITVAGVIYPNSLRTSALARPEDFVGAGATEIAVTDSPHVIVGVKALSDVLMVYSRSNDAQTGALVMMQEVEEPVVWALRVAVSGVAVLSGRSIVDLGTVHELLGADAAYAFDGVQLIEHASHVLRPLLRSIDGDRAEEAIGWRDYENGEINWILPLTSDQGAPISAYIEHYREPRDKGQPVPFGHRQIPATACGYHQQTAPLRWSDFTSETFESSPLAFNSRIGGAGFPIMVFGTDAGTLYHLGSRSDLDGTPYETRARFPVQPVLGYSKRGVGGDRRGLVQRVTPFFEYVPGYLAAVDLVLYGSQQRGESHTELQTISHPMDGSKQHAPMRRMVRLGALGLRAIGSVFRFNGYRVHVSPGPMR